MISVVKIKRKTPTLYLKKTQLNFFSKNRYKIKLKTKYIAAYFAKKAIPKAKPSKIKFNEFGLSMILRICIIPRIQKRTRRISVDKKKEEKVTAGIKKNTSAVEKANSFSFHSMFVSIKIKYDVTQYSPIGIIFITTKLFPKTKQTI